jgi:hypothetical protein
MPLVNRTISNLFGGVSQQPAGIRLDNQCEEMINAYPSITDGLVKRPPTEFIAVIPAPEGEETMTLDDFRNSMIHTINRDGAEKYIVIFTGDPSSPIAIYDLEGNSKSIAYGTLDEDLVFSEDNDKKEYIVGGSPSQDIAAVTVADYTVVVNRAKTISMLPLSSPVHLPIALVTIPHGVADQTYKIFVNGTEVASYTTPNTSTPSGWRTTAIAAALYSDLVGNLTGTWEISVDGSTIFIVNTAGEDFTFKVEDSWGDQAMVGIKESVRRFEDLPETLPSGLDHDFDVVTVGGTGGHHAGWYNISVDGVLKARVYSEDGTRSQIALALYNKLVVNLLSNPLFRCSRDGESITIWRTDHTHSSITVSADGGGIIDVIATTVIDFSGTVFAVKPDPTTQKGTYYVRWNTLSNDGKTTSGNWEECPARGIATKFDFSTLPHRLVRMPDETFAFAPITWADREVGDSISAPDPTYVGGQINDVFFFKNRLGFLSKGNAVLSRAGEFFDFFPTTATDVLDDDPIDAACSSKQVAVLRYGVPFQTQLVLFSDQQQFSLGSGAALFTPKSATADLATSVAVDRCDPVSVGSNIYFASPSGDFTSIREMFVATDTLITDSADVTAHCTTYIPTNIKKLAACEGKDAVFVLSSDEPRSVYVYKFYWNGDQKAQSAWSKWTFDSEIMYKDVIDNYLYLLFAEEQTIGVILGSYTSNTIGMATGGFILQDAAGGFPSVSPGNMVSISGFTDQDYNRVFEVADDSHDANTITFINPFSEYKSGEASGNDITIEVITAGGALASLERINLETKALTAGLPYRLLLDRQTIAAGELISGPFQRNTIGADNGDVFYFTDSAEQFLVMFPNWQQGDILTISGFTDPNFNTDFTVDTITAGFLTCQPVVAWEGWVSDESAGNTISLSIAGLPAASGYTAFSAPYPVQAGDRAFNVRTKECVDVTPDGGSFSVPGNWSGDIVIFGRPYMFDFRFSEFGMKSADPKVYSRAGRGQLRTMNLSFEDTMSFDVVVSTAGRADTTQRFRANSPTTGEKRFMTLGDTRTTRVSIRSDSHLPCKFGGASYETMYSQRSK